MAVDSVRILLFATLLGVAISVPVQDVRHLNSPKTTCSTICPAFPKKIFGGFSTGKSYRFTYKGSSYVQFNEVSSSTAPASNLDIEAEVLISIYSPCDVSLQIKKPHLNGVENKDMVELLTKYPLMAGISNGIVKDVCAHPDDEPVSLNFKKGILSTLQNSMPYFPQTINTTITETDVLGTCPTVYTTHVNDNLFKVSKFKDHKDCIGQHTTDDGSPLTSLFLKSSSLSLVTRSDSDCFQSYDLTHHFLKYAGCTDVKLIQLDDTKSINTIQSSDIKLQHPINGLVVPKLDKIRRTDLIFEIFPGPTSDLLVSVVKNQLKQLCEEIQDEIKESAAVTYEELINNLKRVSKDEIKQLLVDIKAGKFCPKYERLENLYLDALPYLNNAGAVEVMVDQVLSGKVSGGRTFLYTIALHLIKKPCIYSVKAVSPLFESKSAPPSMVLAAGSLIKKYSKFNDHYLQEKDVRDIFQKLANRIDSTCTSSKNNSEKRLQTLTVLKSIGNIGKVSKPLEDSILKCLSSEESDTFVRVSAAQAFRQSSCETKPTEKLLDLALNPIVDMEVRIASYLVAVTCANYEQVSLLLSKIEDEPNKQVQSFILSHLRSLQRSDAPYLRGLRYNLTTFSIPFVYSKDILRLSKSVDMSYYLPTLGVGGGSESSVIYSPESQIPRQIGTNYTVNMFDNILNVGEFSLRTENLETIFIKMIMKHLELQKRKDISLSEILKALNMKQKGKLEVPKLDAFARMFSQEVAFMSASPSEKDFNSDEIIDKIMKLLDKIFLDLHNMKSPPSRGAQLRFDHFVPTSQGISVQLKAAFVTVLTFDSDKKSSITPASSFYTNVFVGFNVGAKSGFRIKIKGSVTPHILSSIVFSKENLKVIFDIPKKIKLIGIHYNCTMITKLAERKDDVDLYPHQGYPVNSVDKCHNPEMTSLNLVLCSHFKSPDYKKVKFFFPFGAMDYSVDASKPQPDKEVLKVLVNAKFEKTEKSMDLKVEAPGTKNPNLVEASLVYKANTDSNSFLVFAQGPNKKGNALQVNVKRRNYPSGSQHIILVYHSNKKQISSSDQVITLKLKESKKGKNRKEFHLNTKNKLKKYVDTNMIVDFYSDSSPYVSKSKCEINKLEFSLIIPKKFNTTHYIRKTPETTDDRFVYDFYSLSKTPSTDFLKVSGNYSSEGQYSLMTRVSHANVSLKFFDSEFSFLSQHSFTHKKKQFHYSLKKTEDEKPLFLTEASLVQTPTSDSGYSINAQVEVPKLIPTYVVNGEYKKISAQETYILIDLKEDGKVLFKAEGTVNVDNTPLQFKERADIKIQNVRYSQEYVVKYQLFFKEGTKDVWIVLSSNGTPFFTSEVELISENDLLSTTIGVTVPKIIDAKLKAEKTRTLLHMALNSFILPNTVHSRKMKASSYLNFIDKEMKVRFDYDLEKDPKKKIEFMTHYDYNYERKYASLKGELGLLDDKYQFGVETILGAYTRDPDNKNLLKVEVIMPNGKDFVFHSECLHIKNTPYRSTTNSILVKTASGERHELKSNYKYDFSKAPVRMMIAGRTEIDSPIVKKIIIVIDTAVDIDEVLQKGHYKMEVESENISYPVKTNLEFTNEEKELKAKALIDLGTSSNIKINGETQFTRNNERRIRDASVQFTVDLSDSKNYNVRVKKDVKSLFLELSFNRKVIVVLEQESPKNGVWLAKLTTPLRRTEAHSALSSDAFILSVYPNRITSEDKYEAEGHFRHKESSLETGARLTYPSRENDMRLQVNIENKDQTSARGTVEIDIFETPQDKVVIEVRTQRSTKFNSLKLEADIKIPNQETVPRLDVEVALSKTDKHLEIFLRKSASEEPKISYVMRINRPTFKTSMVYSKLSTSEENIEMMSEVKHHELLQCTGNTVNGTVSSTKYGSFDFKSAVCTPGYFEFGAKKLSEDKIYMAKVGMKRPDAAKVAIDLIFDSSDAITVDNFWKMESTFNLYGRHKYLPKRPVVLVGAKLWSSRFVTLDAAYNSKGMEDYFNNIIKPAFYGIQTLMVDLYKEIPKEIHENILVKLPKFAVELVLEIHNLKEKLSEEFSVVMEELGITLPNFKELKEKIEASLQKIADTYQKFLEKVDELLNYFGIHTGIEKISRVFHDLDAMIQKALVTAAKEIRRVIDNILDGNLEEVPGGKWLTTKLGFNIWDWIKDKWNNIKNAFINKFNAIKKFIHHYAHALKNAIKNIYKKLMNFPLVKKFAKWVESWFNLDNWYDYKTLFGPSVSSNIFSVTPEEGLIRLQLPVRKSAHSLAVAMRNIGISMPEQQINKETNKQTK